MTIDVHTLSREKLEEIVLAVIRYIDSNTTTLNEALNELRYLCTVLESSSRTID